MLKMKNPKLMKNLCLLIVVTMLLSVVLSSCDGSGASVNDVVRRTAITLSLYVMSDSATPEAIAEVESALNEITESKLTTRVKLVALPKNEYEAAIKNCFEKYDEKMAIKAEEESIQSSIDKASREQAKLDRAAGITAAPTKRPTEPPKTTELYTEKIVWPDLLENQLDIFLITSSDMFADLVENERLAAMDEELTTKAKVLYEYIHPSIMTAGQHGGSTYAIPTNKLIGETTYMAINKRLLDEYNAYAENYNAEIEAELAAALEAETEIEGEPKVPLTVVDLEKIREVDGLKDYLLYVKANYPNVAMFEGPILPDRSYETIFPEYPRFVLAAAAGKSPVYTPSSMPVPTEPKVTEPETDEDGNLVEVETEAPTIPKETFKPQPNPAQINNTPDRVNVSNRFGAAAMTNISIMNQMFRDEGLFATGTIAADAERAAFLRAGTLEDYYGWLQTDATEYEYIVYRAPMASRDDLQTAMFAISSSTALGGNVARAMEVITLLSTNKTFKNTLQYGVQGTHYIYNDNGRIERLNDDYMMNTNNTGNAFIADVLEGENPDKWALAMEHNLQIVNSVFLNVYLDRTKFDEAQISALNVLSEKYYNELISGQFTIPADLVLPEDVELDISALETYEERLNTYIQYVMTPDFEAAGVADLLTAVKEQTAPPEE